MPSRVNIKNMETYIAVGIHPHEQIPQRVVINAMVEGDYPLRPESIKDCFNYESIYQLVVNEWRSKAHRPLLETWVAELLEFIFRQDSRITVAKASICKPDIFPEAEAVGVEMEWTRADFERFVS